MGQYVGRLMGCPRNLRASRASDRAARAAGSATPGAAARTSPARCARRLSLLSGALGRAEHPDHPLLRPGVGVRLEAPQLVTELSLFTARARRQVSQNSCRRPRLITSLRTARTLAA